MAMPDSSWRTGGVDEMPSDSKNAPRSVELTRDGEPWTVIDGRLVEVEGFVERGAGFDHERHDFFFKFLAANFLFEAQVAFGH